jgi:hypothetical protein
MANWYGSGRSNYVRVKDREAFLRWAESLPDVEVVDKDDTFALLATGEGCWPTFRSDGDEELDLATEIAEKSSSSRKSEPKNSVTSPVGQKRSTVQERLCKCQSMIFTHWCVSVGIALPPRRSTDRNCAATSAVSADVALFRPVAARSSPSRPLRIVLDPQGVALEATSPSGSESALACSSSGDHSAFSKPTPGSFQSIRDHAGATNFAAIGDTPVVACRLAARRCGSQRGQCRGAHAVPRSSSSMSEIRPCSSTAGSCG